MRCASTKALGLGIDAPVLASPHSGLKKCGSTAIPAEANASATKRRTAQTRIKSEINETFATIKTHG